MLHLLESAGYPRPRRASWTAAFSATAHASVVAVVALIGTREVIARPGPPEPPEQLIYAAPRAAVAQPVAAAPAASRQTFIRPTIEIPQSVVASFRDVVSRVIPDRLSEMLMNPAAPGISAPGAPQSPTGEGIYSERAVDRAVFPLPTNRNPEYPAILRSANVQGEVVVRFVVDTTGRVESRTIEVASASHALFAESVKRWLVKNRYAPATIGGMPVRQMVEQRVEFALK